MSEFKEHMLKEYAVFLKPIVVTVVFVASLCVAYNQGHEDGVLKAKADEIIAIMANVQTGMQALMADVDERENRHADAIDGLSFAKEFTRELLGTKAPSFYSLAFNG